METPGSEFSWRKLSPDPPATPGAVVYSRPLTGMERMYALIERSMPGHNQPFLGAHISISSPTSSSSESAPGITLSTLQAFALNSWIKTRYQYPMVACKLQLEDRGPGSQMMYYQVEDEASVGRWADRTFKVIVAEGGWTVLREKLSVEFDLPSERDGDCCFFYIIVDPAQLASNSDPVQSFDILLHIHHALADGPGLKTVLHSIISSFSVSSSFGASEEFLWGEEAKCGLMPAQVDIATDEELAGVQEDVDDKAVMDMMAGVVLPDRGLPLYRPSILTTSRSTRGSAVISHTFPSPSFLPSLLSLSRSHGMTITHLITAALAIVVHSTNIAASASEFVDGPRSSPTEKYVYASAVDPRNGRIRPPYCDPNVYVFNTTGVHIFDIPVSLFDKGHNQNESVRSEEVVFWRIARRIKESYDDLKTKKGLIGNGQLWLSKFVEMAKTQGTASIEEANTPPPKPQTCPYFVSDPPGSLQLQPSYPLALPKSSTSTSTPLTQTLILESFQLCPSDNWAKVGARSHSWNGLLTLALNFNYVRNPREEMHRLLEEWTAVLERIVVGAEKS